MKAAWLLLAPLLALGCGSLDPGSSLEGLWREDIAGRDVPERARATLEFRDGRVSGFAGCNHYSARATIAGKSLHTGNAAVTRRACVPEIMEREQRFLASLAETRSYRVEDGSLYLLDQHGATRLRFVRAAGR